MMDYEWRLRLVMAQAGMFKATDLTPLLAEHGIALSESQVWRLVTGKPERLNMRVLAALCEILDCQVADLIEVVPASASSTRKRTSKTMGPTLGKELAPKRVKLRRPGR
jgi:DNA-binding Xre family transcriptional regulator